MKSIYFFILTLFMFTNIKAEDRPWFYIYAAGGGGIIKYDGKIENNNFNPLVYGSSLNPALAAGIEYFYENSPRFEIPTTRVQLGGEIRFLSFLGLGLGVSNVNYRISGLRESILNFGLSLLQSSIYDTNLRQTLASYNIDYDTFLLTLYTNSGQIIPRSINARSVDVTLNIHPFGDGLFDPFIGIGGAYGKCTSNLVSCLGTTAVGKIGIQFNFPSVFFFVQAEGYYLVVREKAGKFGLGLRF